MTQPGDRMAYVDWLRRQPTDDSWPTWRDEGARRGWFEAGTPSPLGRSVAAPEAQSHDISDIDDQSWPRPLRDEALHGVAGEFVRSVETYSEADRAALLVHFLVATGVTVGCQCFASAGDAV